MAFQDLDGDQDFENWVLSSDILVLKLILVLVFILFSNENFYFIQF